MQNVDYCEYCDYCQDYADSCFEYSDYCFWIIRIICFLDYSEFRIMCIIVIIVIIGSQFKICIDLILKKMLFGTALFCRISQLDVVWTFGQRAAVASWADTKGWARLPY